jgi:hypothetical protein
MSPLGGGTADVAALTKYGDARPGDRSEIDSAMAHAVPSTPARTPRVGVRIA